ncbi:MAG: hypothetical protein PHX83_06830 [Acidobacteriia bacterium]|nr:hypothetical protein [Terriglobia bacterium]
MANVVLNPTFATADPLGEPGEAQHWARVSHQHYPGFASFRQPHSFYATSERFQFEDAPARVVGTEPFEYGRATAVGSTTTLTDSTKHWEINEWSGHTFRIVSGTGFGYADVTVATNDATTLTYALQPFTPDTTSRYVMDKPFVFPTAPQWSFIVSAVMVSPINAIQFNGVDLRGAVLPGSSFKITGGPPDTQLDGYWTVVRVDLVGSDSVIYVSEDVLAMAPGARSAFSPILTCTAHEHAWQASVADTTAYPIAPIVAGQTIEVRIDRGNAQTIAFIGGETTAQNVAEVIDELLVGGGARVTGGQVEVYSDSRGPTSFVQVEPITAGLTFDLHEFRGYGQWAQMWPLYFTNAADATTAEIADVLGEHWHHVRATYPGGAAGDAVHVETERNGATATLFIDDALGGFHDAAPLGWPIDPRVATIDDELLFEVNGVPVSVILAPGLLGDRTPELVSGKILATFIAYGVDATSTYSADRVYVDSRVSLVCTGGTANADIGFPTTFTTYGGGTAARVIGFAGSYAVGVDDVGWFSDFSDVTSLYALFAADSPVALNADTFAWSEIYETMDAVTNYYAPFASFYEVGTATGGSPTSLIDTRRNWAVDEFAGLTFKVVSGTGSTFGAVTIVSNTVNTLVYVAPGFTADATTHYRIDGAWTVLADSFDQAWDNEWLATYNPFTPVAGAWKPPGMAPSAQIVGRELTFPLTIRSNANKLTIRSETDGVWYTVTLTGGIYTTVAALVSHLNTRLAITGITDDVIFGNDGNALTLGWDGTANADGALHLASGIGLSAGADARGTLGLWPLASDTGAASVAVPGGFYDGDPVGTWDANNQYGVDPFSRLVFDTVQDPDLATWQPQINGDLAAEFNTTTAYTHSYAEQFKFPTWYGAYVTPGAGSGWAPAMFDSALVPEPFEDFAHGW